MPPAHKRNVDDSRSETSSSVPNHKDGKNHLGPTSGSGIPKTKRAVNGSAAKAPVNVLAGSAPVATINPPTAVNKDPKLPRVCDKSTDYAFPGKLTLMSCSRQIGPQLPTPFSAPTVQPIASTSLPLSPIRTPTSYTIHHQQAFEPLQQSLLVADFAKRNTEDGNSTMPNTSTVPPPPPAGSANPKTTLARARRIKRSRKRQS